MGYCGLDVALLSSYLYVSDAEGKQLMSGPVATERGALSEKLRRFVKEPLKVAIEAGNQTAWLYEALSEMGAEVTVVNPAKVKLIAESRRKTDKVDAKVLCELLRLDGLPRAVHMPCQRTRELRGAVSGAAQAGQCSHEALQRGAGLAEAGGDAPAGRSLEQQDWLGSAPGARVRVRAPEASPERLLPELSGPEGIPEGPGCEVG